MRRLYGLWLLALALKFAGASWDVSWHFRTVRESISPPHLLNGLGEVLFLALFVHEWRRATPERRLPLRVILAGLATWALAVPFDELWHRLYGLDLTTWSPSHLLLFYGTAIMVAGVTLMFLADLGWRPGAPLRVRERPLRERAVLALLVLFTAEAVLFPLTYNEHTTVAVDNARERPWLLDPELAEMALTVPDPYFHGTPAWLYPVYCLGAVALVALLLRRSVGGSGWTLAVLGGYAVLRWGVDATLGATGWPQSVVPWQYVPMALAWEAAWLLPVRPAAQAALGAGASTVAAYGWWVGADAFLRAIPISTASWAGGLMAALAGAALGWLLWDLASDPRAGQGPFAAAVRRRWAGWEAQARDLVARWR